LNTGVVSTKVSGLDRDLIANIAQQEHKGVLDSINDPFESFAGDRPLFSDIVRESNSNLHIVNSAGKSKRKEARKKLTFGRFTEQDLKNLTDFSQDPNDSPERVDTGNFE
jgi:hypothetical protein